MGQSGVDDPNFAYDLLTELTRTFLAYADDVRAQDSAAYAIQVHTRTFTHWHSLCNLQSSTLCVRLCVFHVLYRSYCPSLSAVRVEVTRRAVVCGGDFQSKFRKYWNHTSTAGIHTYAHVDTHIVYVC